MKITLDELDAFDPDLLVSMIEEHHVKVFIFDQDITDLMSDAQIRIAEYIAPLYVKDYDEPDIEDAMAEYKKVLYSPNEEAIYASYEIEITFMLGRRKMVKNETGQAKITGSDAVEIDKLPDGPNIIDISKVYAKANEYCD